MDKNKISKFLNKSLLAKRQNKCLLDFIYENESEYHRLAFTCDEKISLFTILIRIFSEKVETIRLGLINIDSSFLGDLAAWSEIERRLKQSRKDKLANHLVELIVLLVDIYDEL